MLERNNRIGKIFENIKRLAEGYIDRPYPDAPDPDQYIDLIEEQVVMYNKER